MISFALRFTMLGLVFASRVFASACPVVPTPLATYIGFGASGCTINGEIVDSFNFLVGSTNVPSPLTASAIMVTPSFSATDYLLFFSATGGTTSTGFTVPTGEFVNYEIDFNWDPLVGGAGDDMVANTPVNPGTAGVTTDLCAGSIFGGVSCPTNIPTNTLFVFNDGIPADAINTADTFFTSPVLVVGTKSFIDLDATKGGSSTITGFDTQVFIVPEPGAMELVTLGLLVSGCWRLRLRRQPAF